MSDAITIDAIYTAINPLPAKLAEKGKADPVVRFEMEANAGFSININWKKRNSSAGWEREYKCFLGDTFDDVLAKAAMFIKELPTAEQAVLYDFMGQLGKLIDVGRADGIAVDYLNPLLDSMNRLSENVITYKPANSAAR